jgi:hypothetical protein
MRLATVIDPIQSSGLGVSNNFSIAASAKAFDILSSNLYQNKILAVIREISCNAADAHKFVGKDTSGIRIHLPTFGEPWFSVRDFGPGLPQSEVMQLYTTYFQSTKDQSDDLIGGFGLGSKSPFAVTDQFTVTSWHGGFCSEYVMYKDAGLPRVNMIRSTPSNEPTGMLIQVPTSRDFSTYQHEAGNFFKWWDHRPTITPAISIQTNPFGGSLRSPNLTADGKPLWVACKEGSAIALVGMVPYTLDLSAIPNNTTRISGIILPFMVGEVQPNPNRETLSYDPVTCANILKRIEAVRTEVNASMQAHIDACPTLYEARRFLHHTAATDGTNALVRNIAGQMNWSWRGNHILSRAQVSFTLPVIARHTEKRWRQKTWRRNNHNRDHLAHHISNYGGGENICAFVWVPAASTGVTLTPKVHRKIEHNVDAKHPDADHVYIIVGGTYQDISKEMEDAGFPPLIDTTSWPDAPKAIPQPRTKPTANTTGYVYDGRMDYNKTESTIDLKGGGLYVEFFDGSPVPTTTPLRVAAYGGLMPHDRVMGFRRIKLASKNFQSQLAANGWIKYDPATWWATYVDADAFAEEISSCIIKEVFINTGALTAFASAYNNRNKKVNLLAALHPAFQFLDRLAALTDKENRLKYQPYKNMDWSQAQKDAVAKRIAEAQDLLLKWNALVQAKPLFPHIAWHQEGLDFAHVIDYLNA